MAYIATKPKKIAGVLYERGQAVDAAALGMAKIASLLRVGLIIPSDRLDEVAVIPQPEAPAAEELGDLCPECGEGPFRNVRLHITRQHEDQPEEE